MLRILPEYSPNQAFSAEDVIARYRTLGQDHAAPSTSAKYQHIGTAETLRHLERNGFAIHGVQVQHAKATSSRAGFEKHMIRLRMPGAPALADGTVPEVFMRNGHDGCSAYALFAGMFRSFCWNGCVVGASWGVFKVSHIGQDIPARVLDASHKIVDSFVTLRNVIEQWQSIELSPVDQIEFANQAMQLRFPINPETGLLAAPIAPAAVNGARRDVDRRSDLWHTFNRVQENLTQGVPGARGRRGARGLKAIDSTLNLNRGLFNLATGFAANMAAPKVEELAAFAV
jgi:hypothetical protein